MFCFAAAIFTYSGQAVPSREVKSYVGAGLAVLGVNLVSSSNVVHLHPGVSPQSVDVLSCCNALTAC
jgi:hypothetical protein